MNHDSNSPQASFPKTTPAIDFDHLKQYLGDDPAITAEVFELFRHQVELWMRGLDPKLEDDSWSAIMHSLKGTAAAVGAHRLAEYCKSAEQLVGEANSVALRERSVQDIQFQSDLVLVEIGRWEYRQTLAKMRS